MLSACDVHPQRGQANRGSNSSGFLAHTRSASSFTHSISGGSLIGLSASICTGPESHIVVQEAYNPVMPKELTIIFERDAEWWIATIPEVPGAFSQGRSKEEARENVLDALNELMIARRELALRERGTDSEHEPLPLSTTAR